MSTGSRKTDPMVCEGNLWRQMYAKLVGWEWHRIALFIPELKPKKTKWIVLSTSLLTHFSIVKFHGEMGDSYLSWDVSLHLHTLSSMLPSSYLSRALGQYVSGLLFRALVRICTHGRRALTENWPNINLLLTRPNRNREKTQTYMHVSNWYLIYDTVILCLEEGWPTSTHGRVS